MGTVVSGNGKVVYQNYVDNRTAAIAEAKCSADPVCAKQAAEEAAKAAAAAKALCDADPVCAKAAAEAAEAAAKAAAEALALIVKACGSDKTCICTADPKQAACITNPTIKKDAASLTTCAAAFIATVYALSF